MGRAWIVAGATVVGLAGVLAFHTAPARLTVGGLSGPSATSASSPVTGAGVSPHPKTTVLVPPTSHPSAPTSTTPPSSRTATGASVNYNWGVLSVSVTEADNTITRVDVGSLDDGGNPRSQSIDQQSIPLLDQEAMAAQSANIQGVSGASYTSAGFKQSLQSALSKLNP
jgi:uncharacterized protein with FMN-binding domain